MKHKFVTVSQAKSKLLELTRKVDEEGQAYLVTKDGVPVAALVPLEEYESWLETNEIMSDSDLMKSLEAALEDEKKGKLFSRDSSGKWIPHKKKKAGKKAA